LFKYGLENGSGFTIMLRCHSCKTTNSINVGMIVITTTTYCTVLAEAMDIVGTV
jgi:hypothetical protein